MSSVLDNIKQVWQHSSLSHRVTLLAITFGLAVVIGGMLYWSSKPELSLLYGDLSQEDAARIVERLQEREVPYRLGNSGTSVFVPNDQVYSLRLEIASSDLITQGSDGYKLLDRDSLSTSPFKERVNYIRAIAGELEKTIGLIDGVRSARVLLVNDQQRLLGKSDAEASASVYIKTRGGKISQSNVRAVASLVAGAAKGVTPDRVVVVVNGVQESGQEKDELAGTPNSLLEYKMKIEQYLAGKAEDMLSKVLGPQRAAVKVSATLTTTTVNTASKTVDPDNRVATSEETTKSDEKSVARNANNKPGGSSKESTEKIEYLTSYTTESRSERPGKVESLAVSVFVDLSSLGGGDGGDGGGAAAPTAKLTVDQIKDAVRTAIGLPDTSAITVVDVPFHVVNIEEGEEFSPSIMSQVLFYTREFSLGLVVLGMLVGFRLVRGKKSKAMPAITASEGEGSAGAAGGAGGGKSTASIKGPDRALRAQIVNALTTSPEDVKKLFLSWVESEGSK